MFHEALCHVVFFAVPTDIDCLVVFVSSYGQPGRVLGADGGSQLTVAEMLDVVNENEALAGKPCVFILQVCTEHQLVISTLVLSLFHAHTRTHALTHTHTHTLTHTYTHTHARTYTHIHSLSHSFISIHV